MAIIIFTGCKRKKYFWIQFRSHQSKFTI